MPSVSTEFITVGCNRTAHAAAWGVNGLLAFGAEKLIALYDPLLPTSHGIQQTLLGHSDRVICVDFIQRGHEAKLEDVALISGSADNTAKIWKKSGNKWVNSATLQGHTGAIETLGCMRASVIDTDKDLIATGSADGTIRIWERTVVDDTTDNVMCVQTLQCDLKYPLAMALSYLPGTKVPVLATGHTDKRIFIYIFQASKGGFEMAHTLQGHDNWVRSLAFATYTGETADATQKTGMTHTLVHGDLMLASASQDRYIRIWKISPHHPTEPQRQSSPDAKKDTVTNELIEALQESALTGEDVQLSTKAHLVTVDNPAEGASPSQFSLMFEALLMGHDDWVYSVDWEKPRMMTGSDGVSSFQQPMRLVSASSDKSMMIWAPDPSTGVWVNDVRMGDIGGNSYLGFCGALFSPEGKHVISHGANGSFHLWKDVSLNDDQNHWEPEVSISGHFRPVEQLAWDPESRFLVSVSLDQTTRMFAPWNRQIDGTAVSTWHEVGRPQVHGYDLKCITFTHPWQFVSGADEKVLRVFDAPRSCVESLFALTGEKDMASEIEKRPVGANLPALGLSNKAVFEADIEEMANAEESHSALQSYASVSATPTALKETMERPPFEEHLLQHTLWPEVEKLYGHGYEIICTDASHDGKYVATACKAANPEHAVVRLFNTSNWKEVPTKIAAHTLTVTRARFSHNDKWLLTVSRDRMWSLSERQEGNEETPYRLVMTKNKAHARIIWDCSWSADDQLFATGSRDKTIKIWKQSASSEWECVTTIKCPEAVTSLDFAPISVQNERYVLAVGLENGRILLLSALQQQVDQWESWCHVDTSMSHVGVVRSIAWRKAKSPETGRLQFASAGEDHSVRIFNVDY
ncbi:WD40-repeat-containing domain protein [Radiomyces spectabilis]|uniref:WD40-repeat-containing domain protein n=1 Tax=Radiomyces spectabilis TaxID=64574 RepID=UPI00221F2248|nr:WD40-repeat-containing domain protein [Radiomyces spectabilis]KAI8394027.1 WD40-repeat-containing domain protein [Radiomyces spectabilis]